MAKPLIASNLYANLEFLKRTGKLTKSKKILEIGSGAGKLLSILTEEGYNVQGTEYAEDHVATAKELYKGVKIKQMSGDDITYPDNSYDVVISFDVFEHIKDTAKHLSEVKRVLKPGGYYIFCTPNKFTNIPWEVMRYKSLTAWTKYHVALHTYGQLKRALLKAGFKHEFYDVKVMNEFFLNKVKSKLGNFGVTLIKLINPDRFPIPVRTNYYVVAQNAKGD
jgi:2-polyprenyl-3-methyl-5-hydroxy-6-metoxy-1,4-benzoquinol methylase